MLNIGIVGVGQFGQNHARIMAQSELINLVGLYDKNTKRAQEIGKKHGIKVFSNYQNLVDECDAIVIVVNTISHFELAKIALSRHKHVFLEKPVTEELAQARELITMAEANDLRLQVGHIERFNPVILEISPLVKDPIFIEVHRIAPFTARGTDVPVVHELMIHDLDFILAFIKSKVKHISASGSGVMTKSIDIANARLEFENGAVANVTASRISLKRSRQARIFQKDAYFSLDFQEKTVKIVTKSKKLYKVYPKILAGKFDNISQEDVVDIREVKASSTGKDALTAELEAFFTAIEAGSNPLVDGEAGYDALKVAQDIVEKINSSI
ncbi:MAG: Gfo/Idh/MocA family oxidoreductase [Candidatus Cloacimonetes bacterium]|nr:Gfo/Idh/MocA family oxidoreductase [Candidatus Cloacimonadota bacterium]